MPHHSTTRRQFLASSAQVAAGTALAPYLFAGTATADDKPKSKNDRLRIGAIGMHSRGTFVTHTAVPYGDVVAICDVDRQVAEKARATFGGKADLYEDYRKMLERDDLDIVIIGSPDHWHTAMVIDACKAGVDIFCEKPLTLTVDEGKLLCQVVKQTNRVVQVGNWRRSDPRFRLACELVRDGRLGKLKRVTVTMGKNPTSGSFANQPVPKHLNWDKWLGQAPKVPYCPERCHRTFRWFYEYSGAQMTDWGAHFLDIAQWGIGADASGPTSLSGTATYPKIENAYNVATRYAARYLFDDEVEMIVDDGQTRYGILFEGTQGRIFVNDGGVFGKPFEQLADNPLPRDDYKLYPHDDLSVEPKVGTRAAPHNHMANFVRCLKTRELPISDVFTQHRTATLCHLGNISMRLGRELRWDAQKELCLNDDEANGRLSRPQRKGYEIRA